MKNNILQKTISLLVYLVPVVLILIPNSMFFPFITGKNFAFRILVGLGGILYLLLCLSDKTARPKRGFLFYSILGFLGAVFVADIFAVDVTKAFWSNFERMEGFVGIAHVVLFYFLASFVLRTEEKQNNFFVSFLSTGLAIALYGIVQFVGGLATPAHARIDSTLGNPAYLGGVMLFAFFVTLLIFWRKKTEEQAVAKVFLFGSLLFLVQYLYVFIGIKRSNSSFEFSTVAIVAFCFSLVSALMLFLWKNKTFSRVFVPILYTALLFLFAFVTFYTQTRGAVIGLIGGLIAGSVFVLFNKTDKNIKRVSYIILGGVILVVSLFFAFKNTEYVKTHPVLGRFAVISLSETQTQARAIIWPMAIEASFSSPKTALLGFGQEGFNYVFSHYYRNELWRHEPWFDRSHNVFLDWLVAGGLLSLSLYLSLYIFILYVLIRKKYVEDRVFAALVFGLILAYAFQNLFIFDNIASYLLFFAFIGIINSFTEKENFVEKALQKVHPKNTLPPLGIGGVLLGGIVIVYLINIPGIVQNVRLIGAYTNTKRTNDVSVVKSDFLNSINGFPIGRSEGREYFLSFANQLALMPSVPYDVKAYFTEAVVDEYKKQIIEHPKDARSLLAFVTFTNQITLMTTGEKRQDFVRVSSDLLSKIAEVSPNKPQFSLQNAIFYLNQNDAVKAKEILSQQYEKTPELREVAVLYTFSLLLTGKVTEAKQVINPFSVSKGEVPPFLVAEFAKRGVTLK